MKTRIKLLFIGLIAVILFPLCSSAATLNVIGGKLMGASDVTVGGGLYDVRFMEGTCVAVFGGCTPSAFAFSNISDASTASAALLDQVFLDGTFGAFDSDPRLINGNHSIVTIPVVAWTPYGLDSTSGVVDLIAAINGPTESQDIGGWVATSTSIMNNTSEMGGVPGTVSLYAVWSTAASVPEPSTILLLGSGVIGIGGFGFVKKRLV